MPLRRVSIWRGRAAIAGLAVALLAASSLVIAGSAGARDVAEAGASKQPNILVIMTDDEALSDVAYMPNVQKLLAKQGTSFANAVDSFPLCCPARATFNTGQYAHNHGVAGNFYPYGWYGFKNRGNILPRWLQKAGYKTALIGKWLNGYGAKDAHGEVPKGFNIWRGLLDVSAYDYYNFVMNRNGKLRTWGDPVFARKLVKFAHIEVTPGPNGQPHTVQEVLARAHRIFKPNYWGTHKKKNYSPDVTGQTTEQIVRRQAKSKKPFFIWWAPAAPHREDVATTILGRPGQDPRPPPRYKQAVSNLKVPQPPSFNYSDPNDPDNMVSQLPAMSDQQIHQLDLDYQGRIGSVMAVDDHVAKLVKILRQTRQLKNTLIVFLSDNGWVQGQHRITGDKFVPYEESIHVPFIIRGPGVPKGETVTKQVSDIDFASTLLDAAHAKPGRAQDGISLLPVARDPAKAPDRAIELEATSPLFLGEGFPMSYDQPYTGVRTDAYKYVVWKYGARELFDLRNDPYEMHNVIDDPAYADVQSRLEDDLAKLNKCKGKACQVSP